MQKDPAERIKQAFGELYEIVVTLRGPEGCAWDRTQTPRTLRASLLEETYECIDAIEQENTKNLEEELGDIFLLLILIGAVKQEEKAFSLDQVFIKTVEKLKRRHPHVFGQKRNMSPSEIVDQWDKIKRNEKSDVPSVMSGIPAALPPLQTAMAIQKKAVKTGFDWENIQGVLEKLTEEFIELREAMARRKQEEIEEELGDLLFTLVNLCRFLSVEPALALTATNRKFMNRFKQMEEVIRERGWDIRKMTLDQMEDIWNAVK